MSNKLSDRIRGVNLLSIPQSPSRAGFVQTTIEDTSSWPLVGFNRIKDGWIVADGSELSIAAYGELYAVIGDRYATSDYIDNNGDVQTYAAPAAGNFRVPDLRNIYLRGDGQFALGSVLDDQIQNIVGNVLTYTLNRSRHENGSSTGPFGSVNNTKQYLAPTSQASTPSNYAAGIDFDASRVVRAGDETRPKTAVVSIIIKMHSDSGSVSISTDNLVAKDVSVSGDLTIDGDLILSDGSSLSSAGPLVQSGVINSTTNSASSGGSFYVRDTIIFPQPFKAGTFPVITFSFGFANYNPASVKSLTAFVEIAQGGTNPDNDSAIVTTLSTIANLSFRLYWVAVGERPD